MEVDLAKILTEGGASAIIAMLFIYVLNILMNSNTEQQEMHRNEIKEMRQESIIQYNEITNKFTHELKDMNVQFSNSMSTVNESMQKLAFEVHEVKLKVGDNVKSTQ